MSVKPIIQKVVVGGIVINENKVLIIQRASSEELFPNLWELPSGKKEPLEDILKAVVREVKEETGLDTKIEKICNVFNFFVEKDTEIRDTTQINFILKIDGPDIVILTPEHQKFAWVTLNELNKYNLSDEIKKSIQSVFKT